MKHLKKTSLFVMGLLILSLLAGCSHTPPDTAEKMQRLEQHVSGERVIMNGDDVKSLDRDIQFRAYWEETTSTYGPGITVKNGVFNFYTNYNGVVHGFWNEEFRDRIDHYNFDRVDYGGATGKDCMPSVVRIYIDENASENSRAKVEGLLKDLRKICEMEADYHTSDYYFDYIIHLLYTNKASDEVKKAKTLYLTKDSTDDELKLDNFALTGEVVQESQHFPMENGNALIEIYD